MTSSEDDRQVRLRSLPSVDRVVSAMAATGPQPAAAAAARYVIDGARADIRKGLGAPDFDEIVEKAERRLGEDRRGRLRPVLNATGVLIHTNLGRAPLGPDQLEAIALIGGGYSNLEYDLAAGRRGSRYGHAQSLVSSLTGAEAALVVNNNAAALTLVLASLRGGGRGASSAGPQERGGVIVSRGELVEIGGEFRIPDVISTSGARLVEVGTTNRTHLSDYQRAITPDTAVILKVHPANYRMEGFVSSVEARELAQLARESGLWFVYDVGSGLMESETEAAWARSEPPIETALSAGADIVTFSGDKLLGGPQAGIIAGRADLIAPMRRHPLLRALRVDKLVLAALEATLITYEERRADTLPLWQMAHMPLGELDRRCGALVASISRELGDAGIKAEIAGVGAVTGGGSLPGSELESRAVAVTHPERSTAELQRALRHGRVPVIGRIEDDRLLLDLRTIPPSSDEMLGELLIAALKT